MSDECQCPRCKNFARVGLAVPHREPGATSFFEHGMENLLKREKKRWADVEATVEANIAGTPERVKILNEAADITSGDREAEYGPPAFNLQCAGELKLLLRKHARRELTAGEWEAIDLAMTKLGRIVTGPKPKRDTYVDAACYLAIAGEIALKTA